MRKAVNKSLYLFLCSILGMILFSMLHRALFVMYGLLLEINFQTYSFGLTDAAIRTIDFLTMVTAMFLGGWYGTLLGIDWYSLVYGPNAERKAGLFHGFLPHNWRDGKPKKSASAASSKPAVKSETVSVPVMEKVSTILNTPIAETPPIVQKVREWTFDDLLAKPAPVKKTATRKTPAKKTTARKTATKRATAKSVS